MNYRLDEVTNGDYNALRYGYRLHGQRSQLFKVYLSKYLFNGKAFEDFDDDEDAHFLNLDNTFKKFKKKTKVW